MKNKKNKFLNLVFETLSFLIFQRTLITNADDSIRAVVDAFQESCVEPELNEKIRFWQERYSRSILTEYEFLLPNDCTTLSNIVGTCIKESRDPTEEEQEEIMELLEEYFIDEMRGFMEMTIHECERFWKKNNVNVTDKNELLMDYQNILENYRIYGIREELKENFLYFTIKTIKTILHLSYTDFTTEEEKREKEFETEGEMEEFFKEWMVENLDEDTLSYRIRDI